MNQLAGQLTSQIRAIGEVATAVTKGDLSRTIDVGAQGEVKQLTENVNEMIRNLRDTTSKNNEQDWLKTNLARFGGMLQGQKDIGAVATMILSELAPLVKARSGVFYLNEPIDDVPVLRFLAGYAVAPSAENQSFRLRQGLIGQCAFEKRTILMDSAPPEYLVIASGTGAAAPSSIIVLPVTFRKRDSSRHRACVV